MNSFQAHSYRSPLLHSSQQIALFCFLSLCAAMVSPPLPYAALLLLPLWILSFGPGKVSLKLFLGKIAFPTLFLLLSALAIAVSFEWRDSLFLSVQFSRDSVLNATVSFVRSFTAINALFVLIFLVPLPIILNILHGLKVPSVFIEFIKLMYRMISLLEESQIQIRKAQVLRLGYHNFKSNFYSLGQLSSHLFLHSYLKGQRLAKGLESRGFSGELPIQTLSNSCPQPLWWAVAIIYPLTIVAISHFFGVSL